MTRLSGIVWPHKGPSSTFFGIQWHCTLGLEHWECKSVRKSRKLKYQSSKAIWNQHVHGTFESRRLVQSLKSSALVHLCGMETLYCVMWCGGFWATCVILICSLKLKRHMNAKVCPLKIKGHTSLNFWHVFVWCIKNLNVFICRLNLNDICLPVQFPDGVLQLPMTLGTRWSS